MTCLWNGASGKSETIDSAWKLKSNSKVHQLECHHFIRRLWLDIHTCWQLQLKLQSIWVCACRYAFTLSTFNFSTVKLPSVLHSTVITSCLDDGKLIHNEVFQRIPYTLFVNTEIIRTVPLFCWLFIKWFANSFATDFRVSWRHEWVFKTPNCWTWKVKHKLKESLIVVIFVWHTVNLSFIDMNALRWSDERSCKYYWNFRFGFQLNSIFGPIFSTHTPSRKAMTE